MSNEPEALVRRAKAGDADAAGELLRQHLPGLRAFVRLRHGALLRARESSSDLVQSICREALGDLGDLRGDDERSFKRWLYACALHKLAGRREYHRAERRDADREVALQPDGDASYAELLAAYAPVSTPSQDAAAREQVERIEAAFDRLPENYREVLIELRLRGLSTRELAAKLGKTEEAVRHLLFRARARLAMLLD